MTNTPKCTECQHLLPGISKHNNSRSNWYCEISRTECEPYRRIAQAKGDVMPTKTSPRWCPLRGENDMEKWLPPFLTEHEAEIALEKLRVEAILKKHSYNFSEKDWRHHWTLKYFIFCYYRENINCICVKSLENKTSRVQGTIYFKSEKKCLKAIDEVGEHRLAKYFEDN